MKNLLSLATIFAVASQASAHYLFGTLLVNGTASREFQYVRFVTPNETYMEPVEFGRTYPHYNNEIYSTNFTCGRDAIKFAAKTETATIVAGSPIGFRVVPHRETGLSGKYNNTIFHEGPANIYMAKAPGIELEEWPGYEGDWFKIKTWLAANASHWQIDPRGSDLNFTIPATVPPGKYLLRVDHFTYSPYLQFYVNCAHVNIVGPGGGTPGPLAKFPGAYNWTDMDREMRNSNYFRDRTVFKGVGPSVWSR